MKTEILVSNMTLSPLAWFPLEVTGLVARAFGFDGVEYIPTFAGWLQSWADIVSPTAHIRSAHWSWRSESYNPKILVDPLRNIKSKPLKFVSALATYICNPRLESSEKYLSSMQRALKRDDLPVVVYVEALKNKLPKDLPFKNKTVQITPDVLNRYRIETVDDLQHQLAEWTMEPCFDGEHSRNLPDTIKEYVVKNAKEVHLRSGYDLGKLQSVDPSVLYQCESVQRVVVETMWPIGIWNLARQAREIVTQRRYTN